MGGSPLLTPRLTRVLKQSLMLRWLRTIRPLRWSQLAWRLQRRLFGSRVPPPPDVPVPFRAVPLPTGSPIEYRVGSDEIEFLGRKGKLGDWMLGPRFEQRLWTVTLHYHEWIADLVEAGRRDEAAKWLADWFAKVGPGEELAWNEYAVATRIRSWVRILNAAGQVHPLLSSHVERHAEYLHDALAWDLRGNHLVRDLAGLALAASALDCPWAAKWNATVRRVLPKLLEEQILPDGGHYELSPMYHATVLTDLEVLGAPVERMKEWSSWLRHPDGGYAQFGDTALQGPPVTPPRGYRAFEASGYAAWHGPDWSLIFDAGEFGAGEQPGHGHADPLSIEASLGGRRLVVDPGTWGYDDDERRRYDRSSAAHNGPVVGKVDADELWGIFRVGRRHRIVARRFTESESYAAHDGFPGYRVDRKIRWISERAFEVLDRVEGRGAPGVEVGWLIHPDWKIEDAEDGWTLSGPARGRIRLPAGLRRLRDTRAWHPGFGRELQVARLGWSHDGALPIEVAARFERI